MNLDWQLDSRQRRHLVRPRAGTVDDQWRRDGARIRFNRCNATAIYPNTGDLDAFMNVSALSFCGVGQFDRCLVGIGITTGGKENSEFVASEFAGWDELRQLIVG